MIAIGRDEFEKSSILFGDINEFIERTWSRERYESALSAYQDCVVVHDVARKNSIVHTDYADIADAPIEKLLFTHNPDNLTAFGRFSSPTAPWSSIVAVSMNRSGEGFIPLMPMCMSTTSAATW